MSKSPAKPDTVTTPKRVGLNVLQRRERAAWSILDAVRELFPQKFAALEDLRSMYDTFEREEEEELYDQVWLWTEQNRISCDAVNKAALEVAEGRNGPPPTMLVLTTDKIRLGRANPGSVEISDSLKTREGLSAIEADPLHETLDEFLIRAKEHYHRKREFLKRHGFERIRKRESDHFRYLVVHRIGGYTWDEIKECKALGEDGKPFTFPSKSLKTIAGEAGKLAKLLGLAPGRRGRRLGSRDKTRRRPVVRR